MTTWIVTVLVLLHAAAAIAAGAHVLYHYTRPAAAVAWLFALLFLPAIGPVSYLAIAIYGGPRSVRQRRKDAAEVRAATRRGPTTQAGYAGAHTDAGFGGLVNAVSAFPLTRGNRLELVEGAADALRIQLDAIRAAEREVLLQTYVMKPGAVFDRLAEALGHAASRGATVRVLIDPIGSQDLPNDALARLRGLGVATATFLTPNPLKGRFQVNFRNHRKNLVIDGVLAFTGGRNWADEYFPVDGDEAAFRDTTFSVRGPATAQMRRVFLEDWSIATEDESGLDERGPPLESAGDHLVRVLPFGPDETHNAAVDVLGGAFRSARHSILIVTPYFVPGATLAHALRAAALSGVAVEVLLPERCEKRSVDLTARSYFEPLLDAGVTIRLCPEPMLHAKAVVIDDVWATFGSVNLDARSLHLNYELNLEVLGEACARVLRDYFAPDLEASQRVDADAFRSRGVRQRLREKAAALFEPLM